MVSKNRNGVSDNQEVSNLQGSSASSKKVDKQPKINRNAEILGVCKAAVAITQSEGRGLMSSFDEDCESTLSGLVQCFAEGKNVREHLKGGILANDDKDNKLNCFMVVSGWRNRKTANEFYVFSIYHTEFVDELTKLDKNCVENNSKIIQTLSYKNPLRVLYHVFTDEVNWMISEFAKPDRLQNLYTGKQVKPGFEVTTEEFSFRLHQLKLVRGLFENEQIKQFIKRKILAENYQKSIHKQELVAEEQQSKLVQDASNLELSLINAEKQEKKRQKNRMKKQKKLAKKQLAKDSDLTQNAVSIEKVESEEPKCKDSIMSDMAVFRERARINEENITKDAYTIAKEFKKFRIRELERSQDNSLFGIKQLFLYKEFFGEPITKVAAFIVCFLHSLDIEKFERYEKELVDKLLEKDDIDWYKQCMQARTIGDKEWAGYGFD